MFAGGQQGEGASAAFCLPLHKHHFFTKSSVNLLGLDEETLALDLDNFAIANFFKYIVRWGCENAGVPCPLTPSSNVPGPDGSTGSRLSIPLGVPLWGETEAELEAGDGCAVVLCIDTKAKAYSLHITGPSAAAAARRAGLARVLATAQVCLLPMLAPPHPACLGPRPRPHLSPPQALRRQGMVLPQWSPYHREAMANADALRELENTHKVFEYRIP